MGLEFMGKGDPGLQEGGRSTLVSHGPHGSPARLRRPPFAPRGPCTRPPLPDGNFRNLTHPQSCRRESNLTKNPRFGPQ